MYSRRYQLPPARLKLIGYGHARAAATRGAPAHWAKEGIEDVEMMHALAPDATLAYVQIPGADPGLMYDQALSWVVARVRPDVVSYSSGTPEPSPTGPDSLRPCLSRGTPTAGGPAK